MSLIDEIKKVDLAKEQFSKTVLVQCSENLDSTNIVKNDFSNLLDIISEYVGLINLKVTESERHQVTIVLNKILDYIKERNNRNYEKNSKVLKDLIIEISKIYAIITINREVN